MQGTRPVNVALMLVGAGLFIQVVQTFRVLRNLMKQHWMPPLAESPRWLALNVAAPVFIAVLLFALERRQGWARPGLLLLIGRRGRGQPF